MLIKLPNRAIAKAVTKGIVAVTQLSDSRQARMQRPFSDWQSIQPATNTKWGWNHYGIFVPGLDDRLNRYLSVMILIGMPGAQIFDHDEFLSSHPPVVTDPRRLTTVMTSTAAEGHHFLAGYDVGDCEFSEDGRSLRWPDSSAPDLRIELSTDDGRPRALVAGNFPDWSFELELEIGTEVTWFSTSPIYEHYSLLAHARGYLDKGTAHEVIVDSNCTFEYARAVFPQSAFNRRLPEKFKMPTDFFIYQVINLNPTKQLLLGDLGVLDTTIRRSASIRTSGSEPVFFNDDRVSVEITEYDSERPRNSQGTPMRVPRRLRWVLRPDAPQSTHDGDITVDVHVDGPWRNGHGRWMVAACSFETQIDGEELAGSAYIEWVDLRG